MPPSPHSPHGALAGLAGRARSAPVYESLSYEGGVARPVVLAPGGDPLEPPLA